MAKWGEGDPRWIVEQRADATNVNNWHWWVRGGRALRGSQKGAAAFSPWRCCSRRRQGQALPVPAALLARLATLPGLPRHPSLCPALSPQGPWPGSTGTSSQGRAGLAWIDCYPEKRETRAGGQRKPPGRGTFSFAALNDGISLLRNRNSLISQKRAKFF